MSFLRIQAKTIVTAYDIDSLLSAWRCYGKGPERFLVSSFCLEGPITPGRLRRLPKGLRAKLNVVGLHKEEELAA